MAQELLEQEVKLQTTDAGDGLTRDRILVVVLAVATAIIFYLCYLILRPFLSPLAWALALAVIANPLYEQITLRIHRRNVAAVLTVIIVAATIVTPAIFVTKLLVQEAIQGANFLQTEAASGRWQQLLADNPRVAAVVTQLSKSFNLPKQSQEIIDGITSRVSSYVTESVWALVELLITFFALFYFFRDKRTVLQTMRSLMPLSTTEIDQIFARITDTIYATIYGTLVVATLQGILGGLMFWWLGLPAPLLWGAIMGALSIIPVLGAYIIWVPAAILLILEGNWVKALILTGWGTVVVGLIDNLIFPALVGRRLRFHTLPVFFAIIGGLIVFGVAGLVLGPLILAITVALIEVWRRRTVAGRSAEMRLQKL